MRLRAKTERAPSTAFPKKPGHKRKNKETGDGFKIKQKKTVKSYYIFNKPGGCKERAEQYKKFHRWIIGASCVSKTTELRKPVRIKKENYFKAFFNT